MPELCHVATNLVTREHGQPGWQFSHPSNFGDVASDVYIDRGVNIRWRGIFECWRGQFWCVEKPLLKFSTYVWKMSFQTSQSLTRCCPRHNYVKDNVYVEHALLVSTSILTPFVSSEAFTVGNLTWFRTCSCYFLLDVWRVGCQHSHVQHFYK